MRAIVNNLVKRFETSFDFILDLEHEIPQPGEEVKKQGFVK
jgi:hypothetical protein